MLAVDGHGKVIASLGAPETVTYIRSSGKPFQAIPLITSGAAERFGFTKQEIAIVCGSHSGESRHVATVASMLRKIGLDDSALGSLHVRHFLANYRAVGHSELLQVE